MPRQAEITMKKGNHGSCHTTAGAWDTEDAAERTAYKLNPKKGENQQSKGKQDV